MKMTQDELVEYSLRFFEGLIKQFDSIDYDDPETLKHNLENIKNKVIRSYNFINHYKNYRTFDI